MRILSTVCTCGAKALIQRILDGLSTNTVIIDATGTIIFANRNWKEFGKVNGLAGDYSSVGANYLTICKESLGMDSNNCKEIFQGIREVAIGKRNSFLIDYFFQHDNEKSCWLLTVHPFQCDEDNRLILSHLDITRFKNIEERLNAREKELDSSYSVLEKIINKFHQYHNEIEEQLGYGMSQILSNRTHSPGLGDKYSSSDPAKFIGYPEQGEIAFINVLQSCSSMQLTSQEITVASHVLAGKSSKDIARILNVSAETVNFHRKNIRKKLNLQGKKINLRSTLASLCRNQGNSINWPASAPTHQIQLS